MLPPLTHSQTDVRMGFSYRLNYLMGLRGHPERGRGAAIARKLRVTPAAASQWLHKDIIPNRGNLEELAEWLDCESLWLASGEGVTPQAKSLSPVSTGKPELMAKAKAEVLVCLTQCLSEMDLQLSDLPEDLAISLIQHLLQHQERHGEVTKPEILRVLHLMRLK